jgi:hypothetical protein
MLYRMGIVSSQCFFLLVNHTSTLQSQQALLTKHIHILFKYYRYRDSRQKMAGYGNRTAPDSLAEDLTDQHTSTRLGLTDSHGAYSNAHPKYGSGATGGAGFGNKSDPSSFHTASNDEFRFGKHTDTAPYSGANESRAGSGSTGGAGYGNKTGEFGRGSGGT